MARSSPADETQPLSKTPSEPQFYGQRVSREDFRRDPAGVMRRAGPGGVVTIVDATGAPCSVICVLDDPD